MTSRATATTTRAAAPLTTSAGDGHRAGLAQAGLDRVGRWLAGPRGRSSSGSGDHRAAGHGDAHRRGHGHRLGDRLHHLVDLLQDQVETRLGGVGSGARRGVPGTSVRGPSDSVMSGAPRHPIGYPQRSARRPGDQPRDGARCPPPLDTAFPTGRLDAG